jgi:predicted deacylase
VGTARARPGRLAYGTFDAVTLPSGGVDQFPVIIAQGDEPGPVFWLTANIHGPEYTGIIVIHDLLTPELVAQLHGTIIAIPTLNPAGLRTGQRTPYYQTQQDPNRLFPPPTTLTRTPLVPHHPMESAYARLFERMLNTADFLIDLHNFSIGSLPFAFRDPVFYKDGRDKPGAIRLQQQTGQMLEAFGYPVINEYVTHEYLKRGLHRSVSGAALNHARIPAFTVELGGYMTVDRGVVASTCAALRNVLRWAGLLNTPIEPTRPEKTAIPDYPVRRILHPYAPDAGIVHFLVKPGDLILIGQAVARLTDIHGRPIGKHNGLILSEHDGVVLGLTVGATCYQHDPLLSLAVRDESELVLPYPGG